MRIIALGECIYVSVERSFYLYFSNSLCRSRSDPKISQEREVKSKDLTGWWTKRRAAQVLPQVMGSSNNNTVLVISV